MYGLYQEKDHKGFFVQNQIPRRSMQDNSALKKKEVIKERRQRKKNGEK